MKVLVTGGGGFLGSAICRQLCALNHSVVAFQRSAADSLSQLGVEVIQGDICDFAALSGAAIGCDAIIHTAGKAGIWGNREDYWRINVTGTETVIQVCRQAGVGILVHTSSPSIVQGGRDIEGGDESLPVNDKFLAPYPETKARAEKLALGANSSNLKVNALRPHLIWGPDDPHILPRLAASVRRGKLALPGADKTIDTVFVENAARAHIDAMNELAERAHSAGKAYFISNDEPMPQGKIIGKLLRAVGVEAEIKPVPTWLVQVAGVICELLWRRLKLKSEPPVTRFSADQLSTAHWYNISAAKRDLAYRADISTELGLEILRRASAAG